MRTSFIRPLLSGPSLLVAALLAQGLVMQSAQGHEYAAAIKARKYVEVERAASAKLTQEPNNADALIAKTDLILIEGKVSRLDEAIKTAELCIASHAKNSECHEALGNALGTKLQKDGGLSSLGAVGKVRDSFKKAIELDPRNFNAASGLLMFYLEAPGLMGGSTSKAKDLIVETNKLSPAAASIFQASLELKDDNIDKARATALAVNVNGAPVIADLQHDVLLRVGFSYLLEKKLVEAEKTLRDVTQRYPDSARAFLGLGRTLQEQAKYKDALVALEKSLSLEPSAGAFYRLGKVWQGLGDKAKAVPAFEKSLAFVPELGKKTRADAEDQLKVLR